MDEEMIQTLTVSQVEENQSLTLGQVEEVQALAVEQTDEPQEFRVSPDAKFLRGGDGATFTPSVDEDGNLTWTNDGERENPEPVNIKGPKGDDYVLTKADKEEIVGMVPAPELPDFTETDPTVPAWAKAETKPSYTPDEVGADAKGSANSALESAKAYADQQIAAIPTPDVSGQIGQHNVDKDAHNDIRLFLQDLVDRVNALADSDDETLDQMSEIVAYIKDNRELVEQVTSAKVSVADIVDNLTTNVSDRPLSAAQGVALKALIDAITVPTRVSELANDANYLTALPEHEHPQYLTEHQSLAAYVKSSELAAVAKSGSYNDLSNKPTIPTVPTNVSAFTNDLGYSRVIVADTHVRSFTTAQLSEYAAPGHVEHWSSVSNRNSYKTGDICLLKAHNASNSNQKIYIIVVALYPTSGGGVQGLSLGYAPVEWT